MTHQRRADVGGGIVGARAHTSWRSAARVTPLEYGKTGMQATNARRGLLTPLGEADAQRHPAQRHGALQAFPALADGWCERCGFDIELMCDGVLAGVRRRRDACAAPPFRLAARAGLAARMARWRDVPRAEPRLSTRSPASCRRRRRG
jgi:hypothetical protein